MATLHAANLAAVNCVAILRDPRASQCDPFGVGRPDMPSTPKAFRPKAKGRRAAAHAGVTVQTNLHPAL
jgi:hypothetical protein